MMRVGHGYDVHRLVEGRKLILGGVEIPWEKGLLGHSDADVLVHAVMDALLGAAGLWDIGHAFPDNDPAYAGIDSMLLLARVRDMLTEKGYTVGAGGRGRLHQRQGHHRGGAGLYRLRGGHGRPRCGTSESINKEGPLQNTPIAQPHGQTIPQSPTGPAPFTQGGLSTAVLVLSFLLK